MIRRFLLLILISREVIFRVSSYKRRPCVQPRQFQFPDCYVPSLDQSQLLSSASFLFSHDAGTGYMKQGVPSTLISSYAKTQIGTAYDQLNDGARALDIRPKLLSNGTIMLQHGLVTIPVTLNELVVDAMRWCSENSDELVLLLHSNLSYQDENITYDGGQTAVAAISAVYNNLGIAYVNCGDVYGLTIQETMNLAKFSSSMGGGYLLAMDQQDFYLSSCAKSNYIADKLVTCYPNGTLPCTKQNSPAFDDLKAYMVASANNEPTDDSNRLGPPASLEYHPFNTIQAIWQVTTRSAATGLGHLSTLIDDNSKSRVNAKLVDMVYDREFDAVSLFLVDHVKLNGNALLSVLRNTCGQSDLEDECGSQISKPQLRQKPLSTLTFFVTLVIYVAFFVWMTVIVRHYRKYYQHEKQVKRMEQDLKNAENQFRAAIGGHFT